MTRSRWWLALPALLVATSGPALASEIRDKAGMFSPEAVRKAQAELDRIEKETAVPVTIEAIANLGGEAISEVTARHADSVNAHGVYLVIAKKESKIFGEASKGFRKHMSRQRFEAISGAFVPGFKSKDFDAGLLAGVAKIGTELADAKAEAGGSFKSTAPAPRRSGAPAPVAHVPNRSSWGGFSLITIVLGILGILLVIRILGALFSAGRGGYANQGQMMGRGPGYGGGGPGYGGGYGGGGGGGGFMSSMFGGIGGALAGNWLYDQFSGGRHHGSVDQTSYDPGATGAAPIEDAGPEWGVGGGGADWGGDAGGDTGGGAGADWGGDAGTGGGDWGGGGGDVGGGGDWGGGGGDNGGSW